MNLTAAGDLVLLYGQDHKSFIVTLEPGARLDTHRGMLLHDELIGQPWGQRVCTHLGHPVLLLRLSTDDLMRNVKRKSQIVYPKDAGYTLLKLGIRSGARVVEAGTGSGGMALALAQAVMPTGRVYSYDRREDMQKLARRNLARVGLDEYVELKQRDVSEGFDETDADAIFFDLPDPWKYLEQAAAALVLGGFFGCILPTTNQVSQLLHVLQSPRIFGMVEVEELIRRPYKAVPARLRPCDRIVAHTGFLVFARKLVVGTQMDADEADFSDLDTDGH